MPRSISPDSGQVRLLPGTYRIPVAVRPLLFAVLLSSTRPAGFPACVLFAHRGGGLLLTQAVANLVARAAKLADLPLPPAAMAAGRSDSGPEEPFAAELVNSAAVRIDGAGPSPLLRPHRPRWQA